MISELVWKRRGSVVDVGHPSYNGYYYWLHGLLRAEGLSIPKTSKQEKYIWFDVTVFYLWHLRMIVTLTWDVF